MIVMNVSVVGSKQSVVICPPWRQKCPTWIMAIIQMVWTTDDLSCLPF